MSLDHRHDSAIRKYEPLLHYLTANHGQGVTLRLTEIERIIGDHLPPSAHRYDEWWWNGLAGSGRQCHAWLEAGYRCEALDRSAGVVTFRRG